MKSKDKNKPEIILTSDLDWAVDREIEYLLSILDFYDMVTTFFCTHKVDLKGMDKHERAIHPKFIKSRSDEKSIQNLLELYPGAKGIRGHSMYRHNKLLKAFYDFDLWYESNYYIPNQVVKPSFLPYGILAFPVYYADDCPLHFKLLEDGLRVFDFHPANVYKSGIIEKTLLNLLKSIKKEKVKTYTMLEVTERWRELKGL